MIKSVSHIHIIYVVGFLSRVNTQPTTTTLPMFCTNNACYIRPVSVQKNWTDAQQICKNYGSTLPVVSDPVQQNSFEAACRNLTSSNEQGDGIWIGAKALKSDPIIWMWLDESIYNETGNCTI